MLYTNQDYTKVTSRLELPQVCEIQILRDKQALFLLAPNPYLLILSPNQAFVPDRMHVVPVRGEDLHHRHWNILVEFDFHPATGSTCVGRSSFADAAANATTARR